MCPELNGKSADKDEESTSTSQEEPHLTWGMSHFGTLLKKWPIRENGDPVVPAFLAHCSALGMEDVMLVNMLDAFGIPCIRQFPYNGELGQVVLGMSGDGVDIYVPETQLQEARALIQEVQEVSDDELQSDL